MDLGCRRGYETRGRAELPRRSAGPCASVLSAPCRFRRGSGAEPGDRHMPSIDSHHCRKELKVGDKTYLYYSLRAAEAEGLKGVSRLPVSMKVLLENLLRHEDNASVGEDDLRAMSAWIDNKGKVEHEI